MENSIFKFVNYSAKFCRPEFLKQISDSGGNKLRFYVPNLFVCPDSQILFIKSLLFLGNIVRVNLSLKGFRKKSLNAIN